MSNITMVLESVGRGESKATQELFPLVYEELRRLAAARMAREAAGHTLQPTAEVIPTPAYEIVDNMPNRPAIKHGFRACCYRPHSDEIQMAAPSSFATAADYFSTLYHELTHASGAKTRLNRPTLTASAGFGSNSYCKEELIAEMGAAFLCGEAGIFERTVDNSAAYLQGWLKALDHDRSLIITAAAQAQKAADYILNHKPAIIE
jgi:antirestriction protein ArdC